MSSFRLRRFLMVSLLAVAGCGYTPAYGPTGQAEVLRQQVSVDSPGNENEFNLVTRLESRLGRPQVAGYRLSYSVSTGLDAVGFTLGRDASRYNITGKVSFKLHSLATGKVVHESSVDGFTGYSAGVNDATTAPPSTSATISTVAAQRDAFARLMVILADQMVTRLIATSGTWAE
jgi:LPS-assembly lipoprotein